MGKLAGVEGSCECNDNHARHERRSQAPIRTWNQCQPAGAPGPDHLQRSARHPVTPRRPAASSAWPCMAGGVWSAGWENCAKWDHGRAALHPKHSLRGAATTSCWLVTTPALQSRVVLPLQMSASLAGLVLQQGGKDSESAWPASSSEMSVWCTHPKKAPAQAATARKHVHLTSRSSAAVW